MFSSTASTDMKRKLYGSVLLIGGGLSFPQTAHYLQIRLEESLPHIFKGSDTVEVCSNPRVSHTYYVSTLYTSVLSVGLKSL